MYPTNPFRHKRVLGLIMGLAGVCWVALGWLLFQLNVGNYNNFWFPGRVLAYVLLLVAPALTFVPIGRAVGLPSYGYWTIVSWVVFGFIFAFIPSDPTAGANHNLLPLALLLISFFAVLLSVFMPMFYALGLRVFSKRTVRYDYGRAWREAILLAGYIILIAFLSAVHNLNSLTAAVMFLIVVVVELLFLARSR